MEAMAPSAATLEELEAVVERGLASFIEVGTALLEIRDRKLYEAVGFVDFATYAHDRFRIRLAHTYHLMDAATVAGLLSDMSEPPPQNARQAAALAPLARKNPEAAVEVWREVTSSPQPVTAKRVREAVQRRTTASTQRAIAQSGSSIGVWARTRQAVDAQMLTLDPGVLAADLSGDTINISRGFIRRCRAWLDRFEAALNT